MENTRQQKIARQIQRDMADIFSKEAAAFVKGVMITVTTVRVSPDFGYAKIHVSVFPFERSGEILDALHEHIKQIRHALGCRVRNQLKTVPEIEFFIDDSLEYIENIEHLLKQEE